MEENNLPIYEINWFDYPTSYFVMELSFCISDLKSMITYEQSKEFWCKYRNNMIRKIEEKDFEKTLSFWELVLKDFSLDLKQIIPDLSENVKCILDGISDFKKERKLSLETNVRIPLSNEYSKGRFHGRPSERAKAFCLYRDAICKCIGFHFCAKTKGITSKQKKKALEFYNATKDDYFDKLCPLELYNIVRYFVNHGSYELQIGRASCRERV